MGDNDKSNVDDDDDDDDGNDDIDDDDDDDTIRDNNNNDDDDDDDGNDVIKPIDDKGIIAFGDTAIRKECTIKTLVENNVIMFIIRITFMIRLNINFNIFFCDFDFYKSFFIGEDRRKELFF